MNGSQIKTARVRLRLSQPQAAKLVGVDVVAFATWEREDGILEGFPRSAARLLWLMAETFDGEPAMLAEAWRQEVFESDPRKI